MENITIKIQSSLDFQVASIEAVLTEEELTNGTVSYMIDTTVSMVKEASEKLGKAHTKDEVKTTVSKAPVKPSYYSKPKAPVPPVPTAPKYQGMMNSHEPKVGDLKEINGQTYKLCFNKNNGEWFYANQGETTNECPKYIKYE